MGKIHEAIAELVRLGDKHKPIVGAVECGNVFYGVDSDNNFRRINSLNGIKASDSWRVKKRIRFVGLGKDGSESLTVGLYLKIYKQQGTADSNTVVYPSLVRTNSGHLVQLSV
jgi:hypothetical protein